MTPSDPSLIANSQSTTEQSLPNLKISMDVSEGAKDRPQEESIATHTCDPQQNIPTDYSAESQDSASLSEPAAQSKERQIIHVDAGNTNKELVKEKPCGIWQPPVYEEHPEGDAIRRQVEYYFSDENLPGDAHLLMKTGGSQNLPVSVKHICGFARMRKYKPYRSVVESLKKSTLLDVIDEKYLRRKVPLSLAPTVTPQSSEEAYKEKTEKLPVKPVQNLEPWMTKGMLKPTGFEEYWTDAPVSPAVHAQERELYDSDISFSSRIETALSRYSSKRKFHQNIATVFNKFMKYGGINCSQKMFNSLDVDDLDERNAAEIAAINATHKVSEDVLLDEDRWEVDFEGVARGFLSSQMLLTYLGGTTQPEINRTVNILRNFYNYLLHHDVCPEYTKQIYAARKICDLADKELYNTIFVHCHLPGDFNAAVSRLHGGTFAEIFSQGQTWDGADNFGGSEHDSRDVMMAAISAYGTEEQYAKASTMSTFEVVFEEDVIFEVVGIEMADAETDSLYNAARERKPFLKNVGKLHCCGWTYPLARQSTRVEEGRMRPGSTFDLLVEDHILERCFVGMKIEAFMKGLDIGIHWLERVYTISPSYFELLPNEFWDKQKAVIAEEAAIYHDSAGKYEEELNNQVG